MFNRLPLWTCSPLDQFTIRNLFNIMKTFINFNKQNTIFSYFTCCRAFLRKFIGFSRKLYETLLHNLILTILYLYNKRHVGNYIVVFSLSTNLLFMFIQSNPELFSEFLTNYTLLMESSSNNTGSSPGSTGAGPGFDPLPQGNPDKTVFDLNTKRKHNDNLEQEESMQKRTRTSSINTTGQSNILNKLHNKFIKNEDLDVNKAENKIFPEGERDIVLFSDDLKGNITELAIDDKGKLNEAFYNTEDAEGACECCGNKGIGNCKCGGPKDPRFSVPMHPPAPRRFLKKPFCKDAGASSGTYTREYPCCKCAKPFGNYKCSRCDCIYCLNCHKNN